MLRSALPALDAAAALLVAEYAQNTVAELVVWAGPAPWEKVTDRPTATVAPVSKHAIPVRSAARGGSGGGGAAKEDAASEGEEKLPVSTYKPPKKPTEHIKNMRPPIIQVFYQLRGV